MAPSHQVAIIGGGPVGLAMAVDLGLRGISCVLVERRTKPHQIPKGQNLSQRTLEHFYFWGLAENLRAARIIPPEFPGNFIVAYGDLMSDYWYVPTARRAVDAYYFQKGDRLPQYLTEQVLCDKLRDLNSVEARFGWSAASVDQDNGGAYVDILDHSGSNRETLRAEFAVGCDGAHSLVRDQIGISMGGTDHDQLMVLAVFRSKEFNAGLERFPPAYIYRVIHEDLNGYWRFFGRVDERESWFFHAPVPADTDRNNFDFQRLLNEAAGFKFNCDFDHIGFWDLRVLVAEQYRVGRVFIAGDAAHSHPPYGGYGLNNGLEDVANLGWKLTAVLNGWGGDDLLDSYAEERFPVFRETAEDFISERIESDRDFFSRFSPARDVAAFEKAWRDHQAAGGPRVTTYEPNYEGSSVIAGPLGSVCSAHGSHSFAARPGHHLPPQLLSTSRNVFEELGPYFTLIALDVEEQKLTAFKLAADRLGIPLNIIRDQAVDARRAYESGLILVRPDQYVAWAGDKLPDDLASLMEMVVGAG